MAQGGDPTGTGTGGSNLPDLPARIYQIGQIPPRHGGCGAHGAIPIAPTASSTSCSHPRRIWTANTRSGARVTEGMELIDGLKRGEGSGGTVRNPDRIVSMKLA